MEILADNISTVNKSELESNLRIDSEYYQPKYLYIERKIYSVRTKIWGNLGGKFITGPFGSEFTVDSYTHKTNYRYVRGRDVKPFFILDDENVYIPNEDFNRLKKYALKKGDILISVVGTLGNLAIIDEACLPAIFSCKSTAYRFDGLDPLYLIAYLNCFYGKKLLERKTRGAVQTGLNINDLKSIPIYLPNQNEQKLISNLVRKAKESNHKAKSLYFQAEQLLLSQLGIKDISIDENASYIVNIKEAIKSQRIDAEYFQPKFKKILSHVQKNCKTIRLGDIVKIKKGIEPGSDYYKNDGIPFIRVSNLSKYELIDNNQQYLTEELYNKFKKDYQPKVGDILLSKDATPGIALVNREEKQMIICGGILRLQLNTNNINNEYLSLVINSMIVQLQIKRDAGGSIINHWRPEQIRKTIIPLLNINTQMELANLIKKSSIARKETHNFLRQAMMKVENLIERDANDF